MNRSIDLAYILDKKHKYCVATSGGPDSMALLDMCVQQGFSICAFHMNYHKRESALRDQKIVEHYCKRYGIDCFIRDYHFAGLSNFQADARKARYQAAALVMQQQGCDALLVAHHNDDLIETYLMQKESQRIVTTFGLAQETNLFGIRVIRPLLSFTKKECSQYCKEHNIDYGIDESNLSNDYTRNRIRHEVIESMSESQRQEILTEIHNANMSKQDANFELDKASLKLQLNACVDLAYLAKAIRCLLVCFDSTNACRKQVYFDDVAKSLMRKKVFVLKNNWYLFYDDTVVWIEHIPIKESEFIHSLQIMNYKGFKLSNCGSLRQGLSALENEFPLKYRYWQQGDSIETKFGTKKVSRWMIDQKMHPSQRLKTYVVVNNCGKVIYLSGFGCDYSHYYQKEKVFMIE